MTTNVAIEWEPTANTSSAAADWSPIACVRKPTRPSIIAIPSKPPTNSVDATGSRKLPAVKVGGITSRPTFAASKRNLVEELGLVLSDDEEEDRPIFQKPSSTILIPQQAGPQLCVHRFVKGKGKGSLCQKRCVMGKKLCSLHMGVSVKRSSSTSVPKNDSFQHDSYNELNAKLNKLEEMVSKLVKNEDLTKMKKKPSRAFIQRIRIYKLNYEETYRLIGYKDSMPIVQSKGRLFQVKMPTHMERPTPNNKWALVCDTDLPRMVWKEI